MDCPICKRRIKDHQVYRGSHGIEEEYATCKGQQPTTLKGRGL